MRGWFRVWLIGVGCALVTNMAHALPSFSEVKAEYRPSEAKLLARDGRVLHSLRVDKQVRRFAWTSLKDLPPVLVRAVILSEDKRFLEHDGVDWQAAGKAAWTNFWGGNLRGASTLTMQLVGLLDEDGQRRGRRSLLEKISQTALALRLDGQWTKPQILEAYLNLVGFRGEYQGITAMSRGLFGKWPHGLNEREAALAAALLRAPNASPAVVSKRACNLLKDMSRASECDGLDSFASLALSGGLRQGEGEANLALHLARKLLQSPGVDVKSSLNADLQQFARYTLRRHLAVLAKQNVEDGAVVVLDNATGEILAWVGSSGDLSSAAEVDAVTALRQAGSTLKPFLYGVAFSKRLLTPATLLDDSPLSIDAGRGLYAPQNYTQHYRGWVSVRNALGGSLNVPAVRTIIQVTPDALHQQLHTLGLASLKESGEWYGYSLALGSADVSLLQLTNAYRTLANQGQWTPLKAKLDEAKANQAKAKADEGINCQGLGCSGVFTTAPHRAFSPETSFLVSDILADRNARAGTFGLESWLATPYWAAAKTGTSKDMRDNWCLGYSRHYTVGVWVGNASGQPMHDVSGISGAAPVWREVMDWLHRGDPAQGRPKRRSEAPPPPPGLVQQHIRFEPAKEVEREEWFLRGTESKVIYATEAKNLARIAYPTNGVLLALDPDIPPARQRVALTVQGIAADNSSKESKGGKANKANKSKVDWFWQLDQKELAPADKTFLWLPQPGKHQLQLCRRQSSSNSNSCEVLDQVSFEVRAMKAKVGKRSG